MTAGALRWTTLALGLGLFGCGRNASVSRPTAPPVPTGNPTPVEAGGDIVVHLVTGVDSNRLWREYRLSAEDVLGDGRTYRVRPMDDGGSLTDTINQLRADTRVDVAEINVPARTPVVKQSSMGFNEGFEKLPDNFHSQDISRRLALERAHLAARGRGVIVAIIDTGVDLIHPALAQQIIPGYDFVDGDDSPDDLPDGVDNDGNGAIDEATGHGTHVAGLVSLVAPEARIMPLRVLDSDGVGTSYNVARAIEYAVTHQARVLNLSLGLSAYSTTVAHALDGARTAGVIVVVAAGSRHPDGHVDYPAYDHSVWAIAALDAENHASQFSPTFDTVFLSAPGENILSTNWDGSYAVWSGTSMATPLVSGAAALILGRHPDWRTAEVGARLATTALALPGSSGLGAGMVRPGYAVESAVEQDTTIPDLLNQR